MKLKKPKPDRKVQWSTETVDNEHMNKKKSKCCCIYEKPRKFGESSSEEDSDDECEHCKGHVEKKKMKRHDHQHDDEHECQHENAEVNEQATDVVDRKDTHDETIQDDQKEAETMWVSKILDIIYMDKI